MNQSWDHETMEYNYSGSYSDTFSCTYDYYYTGPNGETLKKVITSERYYESNSTSYSNRTVTGEMAYHLDFNAYKVDISYGDSLQLIWFGFKDGSMTMIQEISESISYYEYHSDYYHETNRTIRIYNDTNNDGDYETQVGDPNTYEYNDTYHWDYNNTYNMFGPDSHYPDNITSVKMEYSYDIMWPFVISTQVYSTPNGRKIAWGEMAPPMFNIYNDTDGNGVYSIGESSDDTMGMGMECSDEYRGRISPQAMGNMDQEISYEYNNGSTQTQDPEYSYDYSFPTDVSPSDLAANVTFNEPQETADGLSWSIDYEDFPIRANVGENYGGEQYPDSQNPKYEWCSPTDFSYGFNYDITEERADLSQTFGIGKLSNNSLYEAVEGYSLSVAHYSYFMSSEEITQEGCKSATVPSDIINFTLSGVTTAQIDMGENFPEKKNYTIYDYPNDGNNSEVESLGSTVSQVVISSQEQSQGMYSMVDMLRAFIMPTIKDDTAFEDYTGVLTMTTQNYPVWSGKKIVHDPTFTVFHQTEIGEDQIPGFFAIPLFATIVITVIFIGKKVTKKKKERT